MTYRNHSKGRVSNKYQDGDNIISLLLQLPPIEIVVFGFFLLCQPHYTFNATQFEKLNPDFTVS